jgi:mono/diheme cytochrome c family protein
VTRTRTAAHVLALIAVAGATVLSGHDRETTSVTWTQTISRIMIDRCGQCHRDGGSAFSLLTYDAARPWAVAIRDEIMARTMPPWGAVKGFGQFRNDMALSPAQANLIISWVEGGVPEGDPEDLPDVPVYPPGEAPRLPADAVTVSGDYILAQAMTLDGIWPRQLPSGSSFQVVAELPDGPVEPLVWLYGYREAYSHPFLFKHSLELPAGTVIRGVPADAAVALIPVSGNSRRFE